MCPGWWVIERSKSSSVYPSLKRDPLIKWVIGVGTELNYICLLLYDQRSVTFTKGEPSVYLVTPVSRLTKVRFLFYRKY